MPANTLKVDRTTLFGNPFLAADHGPAGALALYRAWITGRRRSGGAWPQTRQKLARRRQDILRALPTLRGKNLACWCSLPTDGGFDTGHAALLLELANR